LDLARYYLLSSSVQGPDDNLIISVRNLNAETSNRPRRTPVIMCNTVYAVLNFRQNDRSNVSNYDLKSRDIDIASDLIVVVVKTHSDQSLDGLYMF